MPSPTPPVSTELDAINQILSSVGQAPVTTLDMQNPEVAIALDTLRSTSKEIQMEGWSFNTERHVTLTPNSTTKEIAFPVDALEVDTNIDYHRDNYDIVRRNGKLYDKHSHSYQFDEPLVCDIVSYVAFNDAPPTFQAYAINRAARLCAVKMVGDLEIYGLLEQQEAMTRTAFLEYETRQGDYTMFGFQDGQNHYVSYQPFNALSR